MDIKQAYRNIPVHPQDRLLLGMRWEESISVDAALPFGLRSAPLIFSAVGDALQWVMESMGAKWVAHYIDDFVTIGAPDSPECSDNAQIMQAACERVGFPVEPEKSEGPATTISFLGVELDSRMLEIRLPKEKLDRLRAELKEWRGRKACRKRELLSLIGSLSHACKAVRAGRSFLRRLIDLSTVVEKLDHYVRLSREARADIEWWVQYAEAWNGTSMMQSVQEAPPAAVVTSDASGNWGCGAYCGTNWFMLEWLGLFSGCHITVEELVPIVVAAMVWGPSWRGKTILARCDNIAVVAIVNHGSSKNAEAMQLMRCLSFIAATFDFRLVATHIRGRDNILADALSRDNWSLFNSLYPQASKEATPIPPALLDLLVVTMPD